MADEPEPAETSNNIEIESGQPLEEFKKLFYKELDQRDHNIKNQNNEKYTLKQSVYDHAMKALTLSPDNLSSDISAKFKQWVKENLQVDKFEGEDALYCRKRNLPVVTYENLFDIIHECHLTTGHQGRDRTWIAVSNKYAWVPYKAIRLYMTMCNVCKSRITKVRASKSSSPKTFTAKRNRIRTPVRKTVIAPPKIINIRPGFMTRLQVDVIDMTTQPDGDFCYIIHARDLFTDYSWGFAVSSRSVKEIAKHLLQIFSLFGPCGILQSDEGKEFVQNVIRELSIHWKDLIIIIGRGPNGHLLPVDRDKSDFITTLEKWMEFNGPSWSEGLPHVIYSVNNNPARRGGSPYETVFARKPFSLPAGFENFSATGFVNEEDLPFDIQHSLAVDNSILSDKRFPMSHPYRLASHRKKRNRNPVSRLTKSILPKDC